MTKSVFEKLYKLSEKLENEGLLSLASDIDSATAMFVKTAKELGSQGYMVQNERCWQGCYRKKRSSKPKTSAQDIWFECLEEYNKAIKNDGEDWNKYASLNKDVKIANADFAKEINSKVASGFDIGTSVFSTINSSIYDLYYNVVSASESVVKVAEKIENEHPEYLYLSKEANILADEMIKEAQFWNSVKSVLQPATNLLKNRYNNTGDAQSVLSLIDQMTNTLNIYKQQKTKLESAISLNKTFPDQLKSFLGQKLKLLNSKSIAEMKKEVEKTLTQNPYSVEEQKIRQERNPNFPIENPVQGPDNGKPTQPVPTQKDISAIDNELSQSGIKTDLDVEKDNNINEIKNILNSLTPEKINEFLKAAYVKNVFNLKAAQVDLSNVDVLEDAPSSVVNPKPKQKPKLNKDVAQGQAVTDAAMKALKKKKAPVAPTQTISPAATAIPAETVPTPPVAPTAAPVNEPVAPSNSTRDFEPLDRSKKNYLNSQEVMQELGIDQNVFNNLVNRGKIKPFAYGTDLFDKNSIVNLKQYVKENMPSNPVSQDSPAVQPQPQPTQNTTVPSQNFKSKDDLINHLVGADPNRVSEILSKLKKFVTPYDGSAIAGPNDVMAKSKSKNIFKLSTRIS